MISGCISARGVDNIHSIDAIMVKYVHNDILKKSQTMYHQDGNVIYLYVPAGNSSKLNAELNRQWLIWNIPKQLKTPAQSPDLKPIQHLWVILKGVSIKWVLNRKTILRRFFNLILSLWTPLSKMTHKCSIGLRSGDWAGVFNCLRMFHINHCLFNSALCFLLFSCWNI